MKKQKKHDNFAHFMKEFEKLSALEKKMLVLLAETVFDWETYLGLWMLPSDKKFASLFEQYTFEEVADAVSEFVRKKLTLTGPEGTTKTIYWFTHAAIFWSEKLMLEMAPELKPLMLKLKKLKLDPSAL